MGAAYVHVLAAGAMEALAEAEALTETGALGGTTDAEVDGSACGGVAELAWGGADTIARVTEAGGVEVGVTEGDGVEVEARTSGGPSALAVALSTTNSARAATGDDDGAAERGRSGG